MFLNRLSVNYRKPELLSAANLEEAVAGQSKADFIRKNSISLKEARETNYWLTLILATKNFDEKVKFGIVELEKESLNRQNRRQHYR